MSAQTRMADALLRGLGGRTVLLRVAAPAVPGDDAEQTGQGVPGFQDAVLGPVAVLGGDEMVVSATAVERVVGSLAFESVTVLFRDAAGVLVDGVLRQIAAVSSAEAFGAPYLYRLRLTAREE